MRNCSAWNAGAYALRRLSDLHRFGWDCLAGLDGFGEPDTYVKNPDIVLGPLMTLRLAARLVIRFLRRRLYNRRHASPWFVAYRPTGPAASSASRIGRVRLLFPPVGHYCADPFPFSRGGRQFLFFEDYRYDDHKGVISFVEIDGSGAATTPQTVLETDCHLSYPFLFEWQDNVYMMPETSARRTIEVYRAVEFPHRWTFDRNVMRDIGASDSTIYRVGNLYWLFTNTAAPSGKWDEELSLFFAEAPLGPWTAHPRNPVVTDVRRARPAGNLFMSQGRLIRPAQDCSVRYGYAVTFNLVETLSTTEYRERPVDVIRPDWWPGAVCTHTINRTAYIEALDLIVPLSRKALRKADRLQTDRTSVVAEGKRSDRQSAWPQFEPKL
jgi:hypothetical protein